MSRGMQTILCIGAIAVIISPAMVDAKAQWYAPARGTVSAAATGQFTTSFTSQTTGPNGAFLPHQGTTDSPGVLLSFRVYPMAGTGIELNYHDTKFQQMYFNGAPGTQPMFLSTNAREISAAYLFHLRLKRFAPYIGVGGGMTDFALTVATHDSQSQWREAGLVEIGWSRRTRSRLGFRWGARDLIYRAPNFHLPSLTSSRWVSTAEPYVGVYIDLHHE